MRKTVGYFEGTDPALLNTLAAHGIGTMPVSNGFDGHGKLIGYLTKADNINLVVGYYFKVAPPESMDLTLKEIVWSCVIHRVPVLLIAEEELHKAAVKIAGGIPKGVRLVPAANIEAEVFKTLKVKIKTAKKVTAAKGKTKKKKR